MFEAEEVMEVLEINGGLTTVLLPEESQEIWPLVHLPAGVRPGDWVGCTVTAAGVQMVRLPRPAGVVA
ncbi:hypothetical protein GO986_21995 [Deinococcus sp. HMF7620]|uniref:Uncharacterized protein n=1 Tax=Deinococcus arboris TaxID=2682977 RepID=A0A7C9HUI2_9DEIO|nr:hypothetical protein [Deinococcus arboris]MVN89409.1 hypothetical protein [Deinococcus arboris]